MLGFQPAPFINRIQPGPNNQPHKEYSHLCAQPETERNSQPLEQMTELGSLSFQRRGYRAILLILSKPNVFLKLIYKHSRERVLDRNLEHRPEIDNDWITSVYCKGSEL